MVTPEIWKPVVGYEGLYEVSNLGNVRSLDRIVDDVFLDRHRTRRFRGKMLSQKTTKKYKYKQVNLYDENRNGKTWLVHTLVATAFIPNPHGYKEINHIDENGTNNNVSNLEWCDRWYNTHYGTRNKRLSCENGSSAKLTKDDVIEIRLLYNSKVYNVRELSKKYNVSDSQIRRIIRGVNWKNNDCTS